jgi:hypothetical protein
MRFDSRLLPIATVAAGLSLITGCKDKAPTAEVKATPPTATAAASPGTSDAANEEDLRVAQNAMSVAEVLAKLRAGVPKAQILEEVKTRRIPAKIVDATELELAAAGAGRELLKAMKDSQNVLTEAQETAYIQLKIQQQQSRGSGSSAGKK